MNESGSEPTKGARTLWVPRTRVAWLIVVLVVVGLVIGGISALYWAIGPDSVNARNEFARTVVQVLGGGALLTSLYFTYQSLRVNRGSLQLNFDTQQENQQANRDRDVTARFTSAVEQLGSEKPEVRLGAIYALERLSKDSDMDYSTIMELLTAYVRERSPLVKANESEDEREARRNLPVGIDIQAVLTVIQRRGQWLNHGEAVGLDLRGTHLRGAHLQGAHLQGAHLRGADLREADLRDAHLQGADLLGADLREADLRDAHLQGADLLGAHLQGADLLGADFQGAWLQGAHLQDAHLRGAHLQGAYLRGAHLQDAQLQGADLTVTLGLGREQLRQARLSPETKLPYGIEIDLTQYD